MSFAHKTVPLLRIPVAIACSCVLVMSGCGGGGGGGDDRDKCLQYCSFGCAKMTNCGMLPAAEMRMCESECVATTDRINRSGDSCEDAQISMEGMTCYEIAREFGLARTMQADASGSAGGEWLAQIINE